MQVILTEDEYKEFMALRSEHSTLKSVNDNLKCALKSVADNLNIKDISSRCRGDQYCDDCAFGDTVLVNGNGEHFNRCALNGYKNFSK